MSALTRRSALAAAAVQGAVSVLGWPATAQPQKRGGGDAPPAPAKLEDLPAATAALERKTGGRIGLAVLDAGTRARADYRADERFPMCSTFKFLAAAFVLARADRGDEDLERRIQFGERDLVPPYSPVTRDRVHGQGMSLAELCEAAVTLSDNTAGNLVLASFGGPAALTGFTRSLGDDTTQLDRTEPDLNEAAPNDPRDTTSPAAMLELMRKILLNDVLAPHSRERLIGWMQRSPTGDARLKAGLPKEWRVAGKTGSGQNGSAAHVAVVWRPGEVPFLISVYMTGSKAPSGRLNEALAETGRLVTAWLR